MPSRIEMGCSWLNNAVTKAVSEADCATADPGIAKKRIVKSLRISDLVQLERCNASAGVTA